MNKQDLLKHAVMGQKSVSPRAEDLKFDDYKSIFVDNPQQHIALTMRSTTNQLL
ncbi:MAG: hypothetical protein HQK94_19180 [Nitrospirae bacterium]|nr:hypothetical protein [Nitrospirota bacterium]